MNSDHMWTASWNVNLSDAECCGGECSSTKHYEASTGLSWVDSFILWFPGNISYLIMPEYISSILLPGSPHNNSNSHQQLLAYHVQDTVSYASPSHLALQLFSSGKHSISAKLSIEGSLKVAHLCMCQDHAGPIRPLAGLRGGGPPSGSGEPGCFVLGGPVPVTRSPLDADFPPPASSWPSAFFIHGWHRLLLDPDIRRPEGPGTELGSQPLL